MTTTAKGDRNATIAEVLPDYRRWLHKVAYDLVPDAASAEDLAQEGWIAMWRACGTYDPERGSLPAWLTGAARLRMREVAHGHGRYTGHEAVRGVREVDATSLDAILDAEPDLPVLAADLLDGVEQAYHDGEIAAALDALTVEQRTYVVARFWCGLDPMSRIPEIRALVEQVPVLRKRWLWAGTAARPAAREVLAERLAHLVEA